MYFWMIVFIFQSFYHRLSFLIRNTYVNNLILENQILLLFKIYLYNSRMQENVTLKKLIRISTKLKTLKKNVLETMIKRLCCTTKKHKILKICSFLKKHHVSLNNDPNSKWVCFVFLLIFNMIFIFLFFLFIYLLFVLIWFS